MLNRLLRLIWLILLLSGCGGGHSSSGGGSSGSTSQLQFSGASSSIASSSVNSNSAVSSISSSVASTAKVKISGNITYDYVPHNSNHIGLNYSSTAQRPVRGATVELVSAQNNVQAITTTTDLGDYEFSVFQNTDYKIRVKAESKSVVTPTWNFTVVDNTSNDSIYSMVGSLASSGTTDSIRDLNASSGWDIATSSYPASSPRAAAPFAILDTLYTGMKRFNTFGNSKNYASLVAHWSTKNKSVRGEIALGEIETTYYSGNDIYVLGDANNDIDEYDASTILHEFGHYIEYNFFRSDSVGGDHAQGDSIDLRLSMSEGFANAFSGIMLASPFYEDARVGQSNCCFINLAQKNRVHKGYYDESSIESIFYNYYATAGTNKNTNDATSIFSVMRSNAYVNAISFTSIFLFTEQLINQFPDQQTLFVSLLTGQNISGTDQYATNEVDTGGIQSTWPIYKTIVTDNSTAVNVCSSPLYGKYNKLGNSAFLKLTLTQQAPYTINVVKVGSNSAAAKPEIIVYRRGVRVGYGDSALIDPNGLTLNLQADTYIIEVYDASNHDSKNTNSATFCFDIKVKS